MASHWESLAPETVLEFAQPYDGYACPLSANAFGVEFLKFEIGDYATGMPVYVSPTEIPELLECTDEDMLRRVRYTFPADFLSFKTIRTM
eukprot:gene17948-24351_t